MNELELYDLYSKTGIERTIMIFKGSLSQDILVGLAETLIHNISNKLQKTLTKKMFSVFVELSQNINRYSCERVKVDGKYVGAGIIVVNEYDEKFNVVSGNKVENTQLVALTTHLDALNRMNEEELKQYRKSKLKNDREEGAVGAGIGFVDIIRKSGSPLEYKIKPIDKEYSFISFFIRFDKETA